MSGNQNHNAQKTECPRGHPYEKYAHVDPKGGRRCRRCDRERKAVVRAKARETTPQEDGE